LWSKSIRTDPVNQSAGPLPEGCEPLRSISIVRSSFNPQPGLTTRDPRKALPAARRDHDFARLSAAASIPMPLFSVAFRQCLLVAIPRNIK